MNKLYTAVGRYQLNGSKEHRYPSVIVNKREHLLDVQEMMLWSLLNWRIVSLDELTELYNSKERGTGFHAQRTVEDCLCRLVQRGLVAEGVGISGEDALYELLAELYIIPISENPFLRIASFLKLTVIQGAPFPVAKSVFCRDRRNKDEKRVMHIANQAILSTAEIIKCADIGKSDFCCEEELLDTLYGDLYTTSENIAAETRTLPECRSVLTSVANLYLRRQIIFERI